jgi:trigger factor
MNIVAEEMPNCEVSLRVEIPAERVDREWSAVLGQFQKLAKIPGYRPGKAPVAIVEKRHNKDIRGEVETNLIREGIRKAAEDRKLDLLGVSEVKEVELGQDKILRYSAVVVTSPKFDLPDYKTLEIEAAKAVVDDSAVEKALDRLREPHAEYDPVEGRGLQLGDFAVISYKTSIDGKPLVESLPDAPPILAGRENFWIEMEEESFLKGFCQPLLGAKPDEERSYDLTVEADFPLQAMQGKTLHVDATVHAVNTRKLPEWNDELAARILPGKDLEALKSLVRENLERDAEERFEQDKRRASMAKIMEQIQCDLPRQLVADEAISVLREIVEENQVRGISEDEIRNHQDELMGAARQGGADRVRTRFVLLRVAREEKLQVTEQDLLNRVMAMSQRFQIPVKKLVADLKKRDGFSSLRESILAAKALDFIASNVTVREPTVSSSNPA